MATTFTNLSEKEAENQKNIAAGIHLSTFFILAINSLNVLTASSNFLSFLISLPNNFSGRFYFTY